MVERTIVHIGLPKTATTYLQTIFWGNRDLLATRGLVIPGVERRDHLWASRTVREDPNHAKASAHQRGAWRRVLDDLRSRPGTGLVSHEFFAAASAEQARAMVEALPGQVEVVVTAREPLGLFAASWQESLKNGATAPMPDYGRTESDRSTDIWDWRTLDLRLVLERWGAAVPPERTHVLVLDPTAPRDDVWHRFVEILGVDASGVDLSGSFANSSMGVVEAEALRRVNMHLKGFRKAFDKGVYIRTYLADERLVPRRGARFWPEPDQVEDCRRRGELAVEAVRSGGHVVHGDLAHLLVPDELEERRSTLSVTDAEVADVLASLTATMLGDVRRLRRQRRGAAEQATEPGVREAAATLVRALRRGARRS
ncbi:hypothetical protein IEQ44_02290 [Nocardioides sp. Y6]|uniref:Sulfotransferase family protein n=1 Tax=Nocardioides malaquae TaxID=2773426 RepID=A0ABR9RPL0_9ACTN|nr:hypothetical protein [Nocardioides malaquae]MBE7323482.1 hypothetical protein [Nocardioides malaquae]